MAVTVRFFAALREAAGTTHVAVDPAPLPEIIDGLCQRYGEPFATRVKVASGLVDGEPVRLDDPRHVADGSELALLPPFSGGSAVATRQRRLDKLLTAGSLLLPAIVALGAFNDRWAFGLVAIVVGAGSLVDLHASLGEVAPRTMLPTAIALALGPVVLLLIAPDQALTWAPGLVAIAAMLTFLFVLASPRRRDTAAVVGSTLSVGLLVALGATALLLLYDVTPPVHLVGALLVLAVTDTAATLSSRRNADTAGVRVLVASLVVAVPAAAVAWLAAGQPTAFVPFAGYAAAAIVAAATSTRLRASLRSGQADEARVAQPALLIGTADAVLLAAPLALMLQLLAQ